MTSLRQAPSRRDLRAMNSEVELLCFASDAERRLDRAERWLAAFEARFSRFQPPSELSRLNRAAGRSFQASPALFALVETAVALARRSGGVFDPTVLGALEAAGYNRSFNTLTGLRSETGRVAAGDQGWRQVALDPKARSICLPAGVGIDLGGIAKGWAVDRLASMLGRPCLVNGGGDVRAVGRPGDAPGWRVGVADPFAAERDLAVLAVEDRGVATSSSLRRSWAGAAGRLHHLIDPQTGAPSRSDVVQCTAVATTTLLADYHAKVALLLGAAAGLAHLNDAPGTEGLIVLADGSVRRSRRLSAYLP